MRSPVIAASSLFLLLLGAPFTALADPALPAPLSAVDGQRSVRLNVVTDNPAAELQSRQGPGNWVPVCRGACTQVVDGLGKFSIRGPGVTPSKDFTLLSGGPLQTIKVRTGSHFKSEVGGILLAVGVPILASGGLITIIGADVSGSSDPFNVKATPALLGAGITVLLIGAAGIAGGGALQWLHRTSVAIDAGPASGP